jgi:nitrogen PTS system EIIA component
VANDDYDIAQLAAYLHLLPTQVSRLVDRGKLPGRRVAGQWRFSRPEIHQWLEQRIGLSDGEQLVEMERNLERVDPSPEGALSLAALIPQEAIAAPLTARTRGSVITSMAELAASTGILWDPVKMAEAVTAREAMHPTALDIGVALLHPRRPQSSILSESIVALGIVGSGIPFGGRSLTDIFFLICVTEDHQHLRILARLSRMISDEAWLASLRAAGDALEAHELIVQRAEELDES